MGNRQLDEDKAGNAGEENPDEPKHEQDQILRQP